MYKFPAVKYLKSVPSRSNSINKVDPFSVAYYLNYSTHLIEILDAHINFLVCISYSISEGNTNDPTSVYYTILPVKEAFFLFQAQVWTYSSSFQYRLKSSSQRFSFQGSKYFAWMSEVPYSWSLSPYLYASVPPSWRRNLCESRPILLNFSYWESPSPNTTMSPFTKSFSLFLIAFDIHDWKIWALFVGSPSPWVAKINILRSFP